MQPRRQLLYAVQAVDPSHWTPASLQYVLISDCSMQERQLLDQ
jgi:hypothetical protein